MSLQEIMAEIPHLTFAERVSVLEMIAKSLKSEVPASVLHSYRGASVAEVLGIIKFPDGHIPDDKEVDELRWQALQEKYLQ
jgi:hypothetical protein